MLSGPNVACRGSSTSSPRVLIGLINQDALRGVSSISRGRPECRDVTGSRRKHRAVGLRDSQSVNRTFLDCGAARAASTLWPGALPRRARSTIRSPARVEEPGDPAPRSARGAPAQHDGSLSPPGASIARNVAARVVPDIAALGAAPIGIGIGSLCRRHNRGRVTGRTRSGNVRTGIRRRRWTREIAAEIERAHHHSWMCFGEG